MAKLTYDEIMKMMRSEITDELIEKVIHKMGLNKSIVHQDINKSFSYSTVGRDNIVQTNTNNSFKNSADSFYGINTKPNSKDEVNRVKDNNNYKVSA